MVTAPVVIAKVSAATIAAAAAAAAAAMIAAKAIAGVMGLMMAKHLPKIKLQKVIRV